MGTVRPSLHITCRCDDGHSTSHLTKHTSHARQNAAGLLCGGIFETVEDRLRSFVQAEKSRVRSGLVNVTCEKSDTPQANVSP